MDFEVFCKYMAKHHLHLDFSTLGMKAVEMEILEDHPSNDMKANTAEDVIGDDTAVTAKVPMDLSPSNPIFNAFTTNFEKKIFLGSFVLRKFTFRTFLKQSLGLVWFEHVYSKNFCFMFEYFIV